MKPSPHHPEVNNYTTISVGTVSDPELREAGYVNEYMCWIGEYCVRNGITKLTDQQEIIRRLRFNEPMKEESS